MQSYQKFEIKKNSYLLSNLKNKFHFDFVKISHSKFLKNCNYLFIQKYVLIKIILIIKDLDVKIAVQKLILIYLIFKGSYQANLKEQ